MKLGVSSATSIRTTPATPGRPERLLETPFCSALEEALNAPGSGVRVDRVNCGELLYRRGGFVNKFRGAQEGTGDLQGYVIGPGWRLEVETKSKRGRSADAQKARALAAAKAGWVYVKVVASDDLASSVKAAVAAVRAAIAAKYAAELDKALPEPGRFR